jgi:signal peptidase I
MVILLAVLLAIVIGSVLVTVPFLWLGAVFLRAPRATIGRALLASLTLVAISLLLLPASFWVGMASSEEVGIYAGLLAPVALLIAQLFINWFIIKVFFQTTLPRAIAIWSMTLIPSIIFGVVLIYPLKLFVAEAYVVPTNAMAPSIVGYHHESTCPHCHGTLIFSAPEPGQEDFLPPEEERQGICVACRKVSTQRLGKLPVHSPDRILVNKLLTPERWDVIIFRYPPDPKNKYVMRLVGLPGEKVVIKDDAVWINDVKQAVPPDLAGLAYADEMDFHMDLKGTAANPVVLGPDEFFVLGDFSKRSSDSRFWGSVPATNIEGVVCLRYWPMGRWQVLR